ncbi:MAG TPA: AmmeMemoRadiSam system protein A [Thermoleophilia bacterium]|nr:AmmeMemoRadiSam system protein A [Thermoleophilia bacterium]HQG54027.1 AmmeMemoRadiSam system protein A [Thermoleophilia bacterium]
MSGGPGKTDAGGRRPGADTSGPGRGPADYARACVEAFVHGQPAPPPPDDPFYDRPAACFVSLKKRGELRGCIGTLAPAEPDLGAEIARNAYSAAFHDPRFPPLRPEELDDLSVSVDVLSPSEPCDKSDLDPSRYGVIVSSGFRRGVLLPDLEGVDTVATQLAIALQKAGIAPWEDFSLERFTVTRYHEGDPPRD